MLFGHSCINYISRERNKESKIINIIYFNNVIEREWDKDKEKIKCSMNI